MTKTLAQEYVEAYPLADAIQHPNNPRHGDIGAISESIKHHGFYGTLIIQKSTNHILAGNHRTKAALALGITHAPAVIVDVSDDDAKRILLVDNRSNDLASNDDEAITQLLASVYNETESLAGTGYDADDLDQLLADLAYDDSGPIQDPAPTVPDKAQEKRGVEFGDVYANDRLTLVCGDSTDAATWEGVETADMVWTDPPYGVGYQGVPDTPTSGKKRETIDNDELHESDILALWSTTLEFVPLKDGGAIYASGPSRPVGLTFEGELHRLGWLKQRLVWAKNTFALGRSDYHYQHEPIAYGWKPGASHTWNSDRKQTSVLEFDRPSHSQEHPTMKPVELIAYCINNSSRKDEHVIDPFAGSGSTLLAAWQTNRLATGIELDPKYVAVTLDRLEAVGANLQKQ